METPKKNECEKCALKNFLSNNNTYADKYIGCTIKITTILFALALMWYFINEII